MRYLWQAHANDGDTVDTVLLSISKKQRHVFLWLLLKLFVMIGNRHKIAIQYKSTVLFNSLLITTR